MVRDAHESRVLSLLCREASGSKRTVAFGPYLLVVWKLKSGWSSGAPLVSPRLVVGLPALERAGEMTWCSHRAGRGTWRPQSPVPQFTDEKTVAREEGRFPRPASKLEARL